MSAETEVTALINREARLLDEWRLEDWLALYTDDATYWVPIDETTDPRLAASIIYDTRLLIEQRVYRMVHGRGAAQTPQSRFIRMVTNIDVENVSADSATAACNLLLMELRPGDWRQEGMGQARWMAARCSYRLRRTDAGWRIANKTILLLDRTQPVEGLSFII